jgi:parallel beta-helix repeat protein
VIRSCDVTNAKRDEFTGIGINIEGRKNVTIKNAVVRGYKNNIRVLKSENVKIINCDVSYSMAERMCTLSVPGNNMLWIRWLNSWRGYGCGIWMEGTTNSTIRKCRSIYAQNGILIVNSNNNLITENDCAFNDGWGVGLWYSSDNIVSWNLADFGNRKRGVEFGGDSTCFLVCGECNRNYIVGNSMTHGGDGFFLANTPKEDLDLLKIPLGKTGAADDNIIAYNDGSYAAANAFEGTFARGNIYYKNWADDCNYGFWLGFSNDTFVLDNEIKRNGQQGIAIENGSGNHIENNVFEANHGAAVYLWLGHDESKDTHPSCNFEVRDNIIRNQEPVIDLTKSTDYYVGENTLINAKMPDNIVSTKKPDGQTALARFKSSPEFKKLQTILATKPKNFKFYRETPGPFGLDWYELEEYNVRGFRDQLAAYKDTGLASKDVFVLYPRTTKLMADGCTIKTDPRKPNLMRVTAKPNGELRPYLLKLSDGKKTQTIKVEFFAAEWKLKWFKWSGTPQPQSGDKVAWDALFSGTPILEQTVSDTTWSRNLDPPKPLLDGAYAVQATTNVKMLAGTYRFGTGGGGGARILVDGVSVLVGWGMLAGNIDLKEGVHEITIQHLMGGGKTFLRLYWGRS